MASTRRPLVVLAGWLGAQARSMRRYQVLYQDLGFCVETRIASPTSVISASISSHSVDQEMQDLAVDIYRETQQHAGDWFFHSFSNGGCFLWEQVRSLVKKHNGHEPAGLVFDSAPAYFEGRPEELYKVLAYCSWKDQLAARMNIFWGGQKMQRKERAADYWNSIKLDSTTTRQLYLASKDDLLTSFSHLKALAKYRQERFGKDRIWWREWESSPHCAHLLTHPIEYKAAIEEFCHVCLHDKRLLLSRL